MTYHTRNSDDLAPTDCSAVIPDDDRIPAPYTAPDRELPPGVIGILAGACSGFIVGVVFTLIVRAVLRG